MKLISTLQISMLLALTMFLMSFDTKTNPDTSISSTTTVSFNSPTDWPEAEQKAFMESCVESAKGNSEVDGKKYCSCMLEKIMNKYPNVEDAVKMTEDEILQMAPDCIK